MILSDFATLADAQAHTKTTGRKISPDMMLAFLTQFNLIDLLDTPAERANTPKTKEAKGLRHAFGFGSEFNLIKDDPASVLPLLTQMQVDGLVPQDFIDFCVGYANPATKPYEFTTQAEFDEAKDAGETIALNGNAGQHTARINITTQPVKPFNIDIEHRYGPDAGNLTEWHNIGAFRGVDYTQRAYECNIPKSPAVYRELRAVSKVSVGMYLPVYPASQGI